MNDFPGQVLRTAPTLPRHPCHLQPRARYLDLHNAARNIKISHFQDSLYAAQLLAQERASAAAAAAKKKGLKSSLGRIFGKKDKGLKTRTSGGFVTTPMSGSQHSGYPSHSGDPEMVPSDSMGGLGGLAGKGDFDRRKKKK